MPKNSKEPYSKIKELRERQGLTQQELALLMEVTSTSIANWENNRSLVYKIETICKLCSILNCEVHDLIGYRLRDITQKNARDERLKEIQNRLFTKQQEQTDK